MFPHKLSIKCQSAIVRLFTAGRNNEPDIFTITKATQSALITHNKSRFHTVTPQSSLIQDIFGVRNTVCIFPPRNCSVGSTHPVIFVINVMNEKRIFFPSSFLSGLVASVVFMASFGSKENPQNAEYLVSVEGIRSALSRDVSPANSLCWSDEYHNGD